MIGNDDDIEVDLRLSVLKPLHATWLVSLYNHLTSSDGKRHLMKGWEKAGVAGRRWLGVKHPFRLRTHLKV